jgi:glucoamylase
VDEVLGGYHLVWTRVLVNSASALLACGDKTTPLRALIYLACSQQSDGGFPQNFWVDGTPYWKGIQLDEVAFPMILAWRLWQADALQNFRPFTLLRSAVPYLIEHGPVTMQERWEENSGFSPSTLAATISALICVAHMARAYGNDSIAQFIEDYADFLESHIEHWTVTTQGSLVPGIPRHYIRILPVPPGTATPVEDPNTPTIAIANRPPGQPYEFPAKDVVDAGFLELVRYGIRKPGDSIIEDSLQVVDSVLKVTTPYGPCWKRYNHDGYGTNTDGKPYTGWGVGRPWPLLLGERAHYELAAGRDVRKLITAMENFAISSGMLPEQIWDQPDLPEVGLYLGRPSGAAMPLAWAHGEYVKLLRSVADQRVFDLIAPVADRYLRGKGRKDLEYWKSTRRVREIPAGKILRVLIAGDFRLRWSADGGTTVNETTATPSGLGLSFVEIPTREGESMPVQFTFLSAEDAEFNGRSYEVSTIASSGQAIGASEK